MIITEYLAISAVFISGIYLGFKINSSIETIKLQFKKDIN